MHRSIAQVRRCAHAAGLAAAVITTLMATPVLAGATHVSGRIRITGTVTIVSSIPRNVPITGSATATWGAFASAPNGSQSQSQGVSGSATLTRSGNKAVLTLDMPYNFTFAAPPNTNVTVRFEANAQGLDARTIVFIPLPPDGSVTKVALGLSL